MNQITLCKLPKGATARVCKLNGDESFCQRLREIGLSEASIVTKLSGNTSSLYKIKTTTIALNHNAAMAILVEEIPIRIGTLI